MKEEPVLNLSEGAVVRLADESRSVPNGIASRVLIAGPSVRVTLFSFAAGQGLTEHSSPRRALVQVLSGSCQFLVAGVWRDLNAGDLVHLPPGLVHAARAHAGPFTMLLTLCTETPAAAGIEAFAMKTRPTVQADDTPINDDAIFDVRPIPGRVKHAQIFQRWRDLPVGDYFVLLNDHDPIPLRYQFEAEFPGAFSWDYLERGPEEFRVKIVKLHAIGAVAPAAPRPAAPAAARAVAPGETQQLDARGLEPPEPLVRILDALERLPAGAKLRAQTDREPCHLFGEAEQRGFRHESHEQSDGSWLTTLERA